MSQNLALPPCDYSKHIAIRAIEFKEWMQLVKIQAEDSFGVDLYSSAIGECFEDMLEDFEHRLESVFDEIENQHDI